MCHGSASMLLSSGILALVSLVEGACTLVLLLLYACVPAWPQLFLCIIDGKVRIAEVMRWEGAVKRQGGRAQSWEGDRVRRAANTRSREEGIWSNRSWHWAGGTCQHAVSRACRFSYSNKARQYPHSSLAENKLESSCHNKREIRPALWR